MSAFKMSHITVLDVCRKMLELQLIVSGRHGNTVCFTVLLRSLAGRKIDLTCPAEISEMKVYHIISRAIKVSEAGLSLTLLKYLLIIIYSAKC